MLQTPLIAGKPGPGNPQPSPKGKVQRLVERRRIKRSEMGSIQTHNGVDEEIVWSMRSNV